MSENVFQILEIEPTNDKKEIRKAYAGLVKRYHPEEFPEEWKKIHDAYEQALKMAEHVQPPIPAEPPVKIEVSEPSVKIEVLEPPAQEKEPEAEFPEITSESKDERAPEATEEKSDEMDSLFDNIGGMAREQHHQDEETFKRELQEVMNDFRKVSGKNGLDIKEWEDFFNQETRLPYICTREFLEMLGDCFENRRIEVEMYRFLKEQLAVITQYSQDRNIELQNIGLLNPVDYAEKKIYKAYAGESAARGGDDAGTRRRKVRRTVWIIMIVVSAIMRFFAGYTRSTRRVPEVPPITMIENTIADSTVENAGNDTVENTVADSTNDITDKTMADMVTEVDGNTIRIHMSSYFNMMQVGDTKEVMIEAMGEPEEIQKSQENPDYEEAVYSLSKYGDRLVIVLENGVITDIYAENTMEEFNMGIQYETSQDESKGE